MQPTRLWTLRHGEVQDGHVGAFIGTTESELSPLGVHQAEAIRAYLEAASVDAVLSSPRKRAKATVRPLAAALGKIVEPRAALAEMDFGAWEGLRWPEIEARDAAFAAAWQADPGNVECPGGESGNAFAARVQAELERIKTEFKGRTVVVSAHAGTNRAIFADVLGRPYMECFAFAQDYGCLNALGWTPDGFGQIALANFVPGPRSANQGE